MNHQMAIQENYNTQLEMTLEGIQKIEVQKNMKRKKLVFQPYCYRQVMSILDIEMYIPQSHVTRLVDKMVESIPEEKKLKYVIADAGYASEENYLYAIGEEKEPRFEILAPYQTYLKEQSKKDLSKV